MPATAAALLLHDPIRTVRIDAAFGGVPTTASTASCGSCRHVSARRPRPRSSSPSSPRPDVTTRRRRSGRSVRVFLEDGVLLPGQSITRTFEFERPRRTAGSYRITALSGQGNP